MISLVAGGQQPTGAWRIIRSPSTLPNWIPEEPTRRRHLLVFQLPRTRGVLDALHAQTRVVALGWDEVVVE